MHIVLTNDDGIQAPGLAAVARVLKEEHELVIVAPDRGYSAQSHASTLFAPIVLKQMTLPGLEEIPTYAVSGTPADCVRMALESVLDRRPDFVISGINNGFNAGVDIVYSGTVAAAREAYFYGIPAMAWSAGRQEVMPYDLVARQAKKLWEQLAPQMVESPGILNYNYPVRPSRGLRVCPAGGTTRYRFDRETLEDGSWRLELADRENSAHPEGSDRYYLREGYETLTPLLWDPTCHAALSQWEEFLENMNKHTRY